MKDKTDEIFFGEGAEQLRMRIWGDDVPPDELALWLRMTPERRQKLQRRLAAIVAFEDTDADDRDPKRFADLAGVSLARFYGLNQIWKRTRTIAALAPHGASRKGRSAVKMDESLAEAVKLIVFEHPGADQETLAKALFARFSGTASLSYLRRMVGSERANQERASLGGRAGFGRKVLIDATATEIVVHGGDGQLEWLVCGLVVDLATGLIVGQAFGSSTRPADLQADAARDAVKRLKLLRIPYGLDKAEPSFVATVAYDDDIMEVLRRAARLQAAGENVEVIQGSGTRYVGTVLHQALGRRLSTIELRPRFTYSGDQNRPTEEEHGSRALDSDQAAVVIETAIAEHNCRVTVEKLSAVASPSRVAKGLTLLFDS
jgi:hypothetical protein